MTSRRSEDLGFKALTLENWREPDPTSRLFVRPTEIGGFVSMTGADWARAILDRQLDPSVVPLDVIRAFEVARGCMLYGWFFYPLYRLGEEEAFRVLETSTRHAFRLLGGNERVPPYLARIRWLADKQAIPASELERWHAARELRNVGSHPDQPAVMPPGAALKMVEDVAADIDELFARVRRIREEEPATVGAAPHGPWWVPGDPVSFAGGAREKRWREALLDHVPEAPAITEQTGLAIEFAVRNPDRQDIDNLAEPVLSVVVNKRGWFGERRPNLRWLALRKDPSTSPGCRIRPLHAPPSEWLPRTGAILDGVYRGPAPASATSVEFTAWVAQRCPSHADARYAALLRFADQRLNLGDIATGTVKSLIDCMWPVWGGSADRPADTRLDRVVVTREADNMPDHAVALTIWIIS